MPNTYTELDKITVGTATNSVTFTNIPQGYTDLVLITSVGSNNPVEIMVFQVGNGSVDTGSNYSTTYILGNGSTASSGRFSNLTYGALDRNLGVTTTTGGLNTITHFMNYSNTTTNKTILSRANQVDATYNGAEAMVNLWRSTVAINALKVFITNGVLFNVGSTFSLYGIANADQGAAKATGGIITEDATYWYHTFAASGAFVPKQSLTCDVLVVAGGGGGANGNGGGGGGGAGGFRNASAQSFSTSTNYAVTVGGGGAGGANTGASQSGVSGSDSSIIGTGFSYTSTGGGGGVPYNTTPINGGSGGGGGYAVTVGGLGNTPATSPSQGNNGGRGDGAPAYGGGGGGGAGAVGSNGTTAVGGAGGAGSNTISSWSVVTGTGVNGYYAGGGGGASNSSGYTAGTGGLGGGGNGGAGTIGTAAVVNTGSGGGAGGGAYAAGAAGGSGLVVVRYLKV